MSFFQEKKKKSRYLTSLPTIRSIRKFCNHLWALLGAVHLCLLCWEVYKIHLLSDLFGEISWISEPDPIYGPGCWATSVTRLFKTFHEQLLFLMAWVLVSKQQWKPIPEGWRGLRRRKGCILGGEAGLNCTDPFLPFLPFPSPLKSWFPLPWLPYS